jgi:hypothetical protein
MHEISSLYLDHVCSLNALNVRIYFRIAIAGIYMQQLILKTFDLSGKNNLNSSSNFLVYL